MRKCMAWMLMGVMVLAFSAGLTGCSRAQWGSGIGALVGAGGGAIIGHQTGHRTEGALIGAGAGGLVGYGVGNELDKRDTNERLDRLEGDSTYYGDDDF